MGSTTTDLDSVFSSSASYSNDFPTSTIESSTQDTNSSLSDAELRGRWEELIRDEHMLSLIPSHWLTFEPQPSLAHYILAIVYACIFMIGFSGNLLTIWLFAISKTLRKPRNILVINLALGDLLMNCIIPLLIANSMNERPIIGEKGCQAYGFLGGLSGTVAIISITAISLERFLTITRHGRHGNLTTRNAIYIAIFLWVYSLSFCLPPLFDLVSPYVPEGYLTTCTFNYLSHELRDRIFVFVFFVGAWLLPFIIISYSYIRIIMTVYRSSEILAGDNFSGGDSRHAASRQEDSLTTSDAQISLSVMDRHQGSANSNDNTNREDDRTACFSSYHPGSMLQRLNESFKRGKQDKSSNENELRNSEKRRSPYKNVHSVDMRKLWIRERAVTKFAVTLLAVWMIAWTPYATVALIGIFTSGDTRHALLTPTGSMLPAVFAKLASCIDPFVYGFYHPQFKRELILKIPRLRRYFSGFYAEKSRSMTTYRRSVPDSSGVDASKNFTSNPQNHNGSSANLSKLCSPRKSRQSATSQNDTMHEMTVKADERGRTHTMISLRPASALSTSSIYDRRKSRESAV